MPEMEEGIGSYLSMVSGCILMRSSAVKAKPFSAEQKRGFPYIPPNSCSILDTTKPLSYMVMISGSGSGGGVLNFASLDLTVFAKSPVAHILIQQMLQFTVGLLLAHQKHVLVGIRQSMERVRITIFICQAQQLVLPTLISFSTLS